MNEHLSKTTILKYAAGMLSSQEQKEIGKHLDTCNTCLAKVTHGFAKMQESCARAQSLFTRYHNDMLDRKDADFVRQHLTICDDCLAKYKLVAEKDVIDGNTMASFDNRKTEQDIEMEKQLKELYQKTDVDTKTSATQKQTKRNATSESNKKKKS